MSRNVFENRASPITPPSRDQCTLLLFFNETLRRAYGTIARYTLGTVIARLVANVQAAYVQQQQQQNVSESKTKSRRLYRRADRDNIYVKNNNNKTSKIQNKSNKQVHDVPLRIRDVFVVYPLSRRRRRIIPFVLPMRVVTRLSSNTIYIYI